MTRIVCGWCNGATVNGGTCDQCGRDPRLPWTQRGRPPQELPDTPAGRPTLDAASIREVYTSARSALIAAGREPTVEAIAERVNRDPRTVRDWKRRFGL
jgi:hypothetical protein